MPSVPAIDPEFAVVLEQFPIELGDLSLETLAAIRQQGLGGQVALSDAVERVDHAVPGPEGAPEVTVRVHTPIGAEGPLPCVYSIHGGGYVLGTYEIDDSRHDMWCPKLGYIGVSVEYRLAPECPYPGPLEDCYAGLAWTYEHAAQLGIDPARIGISGASAGGGLAAGLALLARDRGEIPIAFQCLIYPMIDDRQITRSSRLDGLPIWSTAANTFGWRSYLGQLYGQSDVPAYAAPARAEDLSGLPPTFICVGTADGFCDEDIAYGQRLLAADVPTELHVYPGAPHGFDAFGPATTISRRGAQAIEEWLQTHL